MRGYHCGEGQPGSCPLAAAPSVPLAIGGSAGWPHTASPPRPAAAAVESISWGLPPPPLSYPTGGFHSGGGWGNALPPGDKRNTGRALGGCPLATLCSDQGAADPEGPVIAGSRKQGG